MVLDLNGPKAPIASHEKEAGAQKIPSKKEASAGTIIRSYFRGRVVTKKWGTLPDGEYDKNTVTFFCCRNDNRASSPMILPIAEPFVLYRCGGECQAVAGTTVQDDFIKYDDTSRVRSKNKCTGAHPDDDDCDGEHRIHFCYYRRK